MKTKICAEIGINYAFGDSKSNFLNNALTLIDAAYISGCDYVKFQKRDPLLCVPEHQKNILKTVPWHNNQITYLQYKKEIEFNKFEYDIINTYCKNKEIKWFASVWDEPSVDFISQYTDIIKIPSALITNTNLIKYARKKSKLLLLSTGMSTEDEISNAIKESNPNVIFHTNSSYPCEPINLKFGYIKWLKEKYPDKQIGYSGHESKIFTTLATIPLGVSWIERHITLDKNKWGSDQSSAVEIRDFIQLVKGIRDIESAISSGYGYREVGQEELNKRLTLRGI